MDICEQLKRCRCLEGFIDEDHLWGYQLRFINNELYAGKFLVFTNFDHGSLHVHKDKDETFVVLVGEIFVQGNWGRICLKQGESLRVDPEREHEMWAKSLPCVVLEVSTHDDDEDTYRRDLK